jgi:hypothetical protein
MPKWNVSFVAEVGSLLPPLLNRAKIDATWGNANQRRTRDEGKSPIGTTHQCAVPE